MADNHEITAYNADPAQQVIDDGLLSCLVSFSKLMISTIKHSTERIILEDIQVEFYTLVRVRWKMFVKTRIWLTNHR
ncbi:MAG: hypothetical protein R2875_02840 [Desulfobacterales bacterium]